MKLKAYCVVMTIVVLCLVAYLYVEIKVSLEGRTYHFSVFKEKFDTVRRIPGTPYLIVHEKATGACFIARDDATDIHYADPRLCE